MSELKYLAGAKKVLEALSSAEDIIRAAQGTEDNLKRLVNEERAAQERRNEAVDQADTAEAEFNNKKKEYGASITKLGRRLSQMQTKADSLIADGQEQAQSLVNEAKKTSAQLVTDARAYVAEATKAAEKAKAETETARNELERIRVDMRQLIKVVA